MIQLSSSSSSLCVLFALCYSATTALILLAPEDSTSIMTELYNFTSIEEDPDTLSSESWNLQIPQSSLLNVDETDEVSLASDIQIPQGKNTMERPRFFKGKSRRRGGRLDADDTTIPENSRSRSLDRAESRRQSAMQNDMGSDAMDSMSQRISNTGKMYPVEPFASTSSSTLSFDRVSVPHSRRRRDLRATISRKRNNIWSTLRRRFRTMRVRQYPRSHPRATARLAQPVIVSKRTRVDAKIGVLIVVDNSIFRHFMESNGQDSKVAVAKIRRYYGMVFAMMDERFRTIKDPLLSVTVSISGILIAETRDDCLWLEKIADWSKEKTHGRASVNTDKTLNLFGKWVSKRRDLPEYDHAMLFTAYRLSNEQDVGLGGMAYLNAICDTKSGNAVSVVGDQGDFQSVKIATHELAHSLGAKHDGDRGCEACPSTSNYIMSSLTTNKPQALRNAFFFSPCSIRDMANHLSKAKSACVRNEPRVYYTYDIERLPPGRIYNANVQCKLIFGNRSDFCWEANLPHIMCGQLWCRDPNLTNGCRTNSYLSALPGTQCGAHKVCKLGECVRDTFQYQDLIRQRSEERSNAIPKIPKPSFRMRGPRRTRRHRDSNHRSKSRSKSRDRPRHRNSKYNRRRLRQRNRRRNRCKGDKNARYCRGLIELNPTVCKRKAVRQYCCSTCRRK